MNTKAIIELCDSCFEDAEELFASALQLREKIYGKDHPYIDVISSNVGVLFIMLRNFSRAGNIFTKSIEFREKRIGWGSVDVSISVSNMAYLLLNQQDKINAKLFSNAAAVINSYLGSN